MSLSSIYNIILFLQAFSVFNVIVLETKTKGRHVDCVKKNNLEVFKNEKRKTKNKKKDTKRVQTPITLFIL